VACLCFSIFAPIGKWIEDLDSEARQVSNLVRRRGQPHDFRGCSNIASTVGWTWFPMLDLLPNHKASPISKHRTVHRQRSESSDDASDPSLPLDCSCRTLPARDSRATLKFGDSYRRNADVLMREAFEPCRYRAVIFGFRVSEITSVSGPPKGVASKRSFRGSKTPALPMRVLLTNLWSAAVPFLRSPRPPDPSSCR
jgi:hypothetical protein